MGRFLSKVLCTSFVVGTLLSGGCDDHGPGLDMTGPTEDFAVNTPDMITPSPDLAGPARDMTGMPGDMAGQPRDMAGPPADLAGPVRDMTGPPADLAGPVRDMTGPPADLAGPPADLSGPPADLSGPVRDMTGPAVDLSVPVMDLAMPPADMSGPRDLAMPPVDMTGPRDMVTTPADMSGPRDMAMTVTGGIGDSCTDDAACKVGGAPKCWKSNVLNNPANPATPSGYCSSTCSADADCGSGNRCVNLGAGNYCLAGCSNATTCRHPGYACQYYATAGICFPDTGLDCDPKATGGTCTETGTGVAGGCLRQAYENKGICSAGCTVGTGTCTARGGVNRQCIYLDATRGPAMDTWKGLICAQSPATPVDSGMPCNYLNDCKDGYECDGATSTCQQLCTKGGSPMCTMGMCSDAFMTPTGGVGICR